MPTLQLMSTTRTARNQQRNAPNPPSPGKVHHWISWHGQFQKRPESQRMRVTTAALWRWYRGHGPAPFDFAARCHKDMNMIGWKIEEWGKQSHPHTWPQLYAVIKPQRKGQWQPQNQPSEIKLAGQSLNTSRLSAMPIEQCIHIAIINAR